MRELTALVAVAEEGGISAAARRLHVSQPALSQTVNALEREFETKLFVRTTSGVQPTGAGLILVEEARAILAQRDQAMRRMAEFTTGTAGVIRIGIPLELDPKVLSCTLMTFATKYPEIELIPRRLSSAAQIAALRQGRLEVGLVRERPTGPDLDAMLVSQENLGILLASDIAEELVGADGAQLDALRGLKWVAFRRADSPAWFDALTATLRGHGIDIGVPAHDELELIAPIKFAAVVARRAFALAPPYRAACTPEMVTYSALVGNPLVRRTWVVWPANSRRRDIGQLIATFETSGRPADTE